MAGAAGFVGGAAVGHYMTKDYSHHGYERRGFQSFRRFRGRQLIERRSLTQMTREDARARRMCSENRNVKQVQPLCGFRGFGWSKVSLIATPSRNT